MELCQRNLISSAKRLPSQDLKLKIFIESVLKCNKSIVASKSVIHWASDLNVMVCFELYNQNFSLYIWAKQTQKLAPEYWRLQCSFLRTDVTAWPTSVFFFLLLFSQTVCWEIMLNWSFLPLTVSYHFPIYYKEMPSRFRKERKTF